MAKEYARKLYLSKAWQSLRDSYIAERRAIDGGLCEECHEAPGYIVHHKVSVTESNIDDVNVTLNRENLMYVCKNCHDGFEGHGAGGHGRAKALCTFGPDGQPISLRDIDLKRD